MRVLQISTYDITGGAGRAAYRLHLGLRRLGHDSVMLVRSKESRDDHVMCVTHGNGLKEQPEGGFSFGNSIQEHYISSNRTEISNTLFSFPYPGFDLTCLPMVRDADIINLHWVARYQSPVTTKKLFDLDKPVVWTLHDQWPFTGGCHYSAGCKKYRHLCVQCPQLADDPVGLPQAILKDKLRLFQGARLELVTPSRWMAGCAKESALFRNNPVHVIPNSLETEVFRPLPKSEAKAAIGLEPESLTILFGGEYGGERRKGFAELVAALEHVRPEERFNDMIRSKRVTVLCFGHPSDRLASLGLPVMSMGYLESEHKIREAYSAADLFILPSLEDNLPNTMLEAMSCGTPVVSFDLGGMPDVIVSGATGQLIPPFDTAQMGDAILSLLLDEEKRRSLGLACRKRIEEGFGLEVQASRYRALYKEMLKRGPGRRRKQDPRIVGSEGSNKAEAVMERTLGPNMKDMQHRVLLHAFRRFSDGSHSQIETLHTRMAALEKDWQERLRLIERLGGQLEAAETDRGARGKLIEEISERLRESEADRDARGRLLEKLSQDVRLSEEDREARLRLIEGLSERLRNSEEDRIKRGKNIEELSTQVQRAEGEVESRLEEIERLKEYLEESERDRADRLRLIQDTSTRLEAAEADRIARGHLIKKLSEALKTTTEESAERLTLIREISARLEASGEDRIERRNQIETLNRSLRTCEEDRAARLDVINKLVEQLKGSDEERAALEERIRKEAEILRGSLVGLLRHRREVMREHWEDSEKR